ncbi:hypothetical protein N7509_000115 [Penicillium cosmopolitanum]|uniref:Uncharacterized protein n=1 Tax=Penicillium cosmopolitanum TaxID=1131564 RepID=A0A9W9WCY8_9EURO|nr:uncharacterized protein N7509_000115 [Penicillium cosmopolitanum]KAJ5415017.1 hypothetical protein N7509_000115 [Penicillium cosmopolitanum]
MTERVSESSIPRYSEYRARLTKVLEDQSSTEESACQEDAITRRHRSSTVKKTKRDDKRADKDGESGKSGGHDTLSKSWKKRKAVDDLSVGRQRNASPAIELELESKATKRLLKRKLASEIESLRTEIEDMKKAVACLKPSLDAQRKRKRVSFEDSAR